ncbi:MAG TPA: hypothetical protein DCQ26_10430 [Marinilabiliales bacterium]|jgi:hypothetical protein|nr:MAG: hypothetical protein A2W95_05415 [Bacteroidetes bacterium GWA2_40_14]OFX59903.1 MAG: hypothetical protein A2W84_02175 [Bacteroidetes bacterium GWC2_40_13]OFX75126.1 MAG: hypothetical protein A2W96_17185 [Bacteroidetes bacterium GWD2_40_43]OFX93825.1 MAG: hypothetical protein A2W97_00200 [Bacteroidetes bacterium GWE2_40_63]OFY18102.1 MAG: hypothetical protein A2W88_01130 [Bacteroidetes bacterium GWF2_40_13]OFZ27287.1 MAG: hypothetical protein A2437_13575 [Bacteroidetes bacterium RIFOXYC
MKAGVKIGIILASVLVTPLIIGLFQPKERLVTEMDLIDKMYFFILADITNHWEESVWRHDLDTMIQKDVVDGQDAWMEYYTNGDSVLLITQKTTETDYIRIIHKPDGRQLMRVITLADYKGKTAIRMSEEVYVANPVKRFINLFADPTKKRIRNYLNDLKEKNKPDPNAEQVDSF